MTKLTHLHRNRGEISVEMGQLSYHVIKCYRNSDVNEMMTIVSGETLNEVNFFSCPMLILYYHHACIIHGIMQ